MYVVQYSFHSAFVIVRGQLLRNDCLMSFLPLWISDVKLPILFQALFIC